MEASGLHEARRVLNYFREVVFSMIYDQDKIDAPFVRMWIALGEAIEMADALHESYVGLSKQVRLLEKQKSRKR